MPIQVQILISIEDYKNYLKMQKEIKNRKKYKKNTKGLYNVFPVPLTVVNNFKLEINNRAINKTRFLFIRFYFQWIRTIKINKIYFVIHIHF